MADDTDGTIPENGIDCVDLRHGALEEQVDDMGADLQCCNSLCEEVGTCVCGMSSQQISNSAGMCIISWKWGSMETEMLDKQR